MNYLKKSAWSVGLWAQRIGGAVVGIAFGLFGLLAFPTAYAAPPLSEKISSDDLPPVWPDAEGSVRGYAIVPLYSSVPAAAKSDSLLYEYLALVDALRIGRARERRFAEEELKHRLKQYSVQRRLSS